MNIKLGATRKVFIFNNIVIKTPNMKEYRLFINGILSNLQEKEFSKIGRKDLAKVIFCDKLGLFLIMKKLNEVDVNINWIEFRNKLEEIYQNEDDNMKQFMLSDMKPSNWGYDENGMLVKIDYGNEIGDYGVRK